MVNEPSGIPRPAQNILEAAETIERVSNKWLPLVEKIEEKGLVFKLFGFTLLTIRVGDDPK